ncbi:MAG: phospho-N-acetylmuramoyl-pentapeptide-transferase [Candidatus Paceibacterota bacterium]|jgi:phospho-N-acetylmuramoyl-pentapeptide-transferase
MDSLTFDVVRLIITVVSSFLLALFFTPLLTKLLERYGLVKYVERENVPIFTKLHKKKEGTPTMGGILVWGTVLLTIILFEIIGKLGKGTYLENLSFLSRQETFLPLGAMLVAALLGLVDDIFGILRIGVRKSGLRVREKIILYTIVAGFCAWWFYFKLDWDLIKIPFVGSFYIGLWYIPVFIFIIVATAFSTNETDGLDGLAGGVLIVAFTALGIIAFTQNKIDLAAFCGAITGSLLAFLWYNIYPAKFFLGDTGSMGLGVTLGIIAMLTNTALLLPFIGFVLVFESVSVILQTGSKKIFGRKIFISTPIHHHFEARGWHESKVTMRFWIIAGVTASIGLIIYLLT